MGIDPADFVWQDLAKCSGMPRDYFFDMYESDVEVAKQIDDCCLNCPVIKECSAAGMNGQYGVWGAIYWNGAGRPDSNRNAHKTPEVYAKLKDRLTS